MNTILDVIDTNIDEPGWRYATYLITLALLIPIIASVIQALLHVLSRLCPGRDADSLWLVKIGGLLRRGAHALQARGRNRHSLWGDLGDVLLIVAGAFDPASLPGHRVTVSAQILFRVQTLEQAGLTVYRRFYSVFRPGTLLAATSLVLLFRPPQDTFPALAQVASDVWRDVSKVDVRLVLALVPLALALVVFATRGALIERVRMRDEAIKEAAKYAGRLLGAAEQLRTALDAEHIHNAEQFHVGIAIKALVGEASDHRYVWDMFDRKITAARLTPAKVDEPGPLGTVEVDEAAAKLHLLLNEVADAGLRRPLANLLWPIHWHLVEADLDPLNHRLDTRPLHELGRAAADDLQAEQLAALRDHFTAIAVIAELSSNNPEYDDREIRQLAEACARMHRDWDNRSLINRHAYLHLGPIIHHINRRQAGSGMLMRVVSSFKA